MKEEKTYSVKADVTLSIEADSEESAKEIAEHILYKSDWVSSYNISDSVEEE